MSRLPRSRGRVCVRSRYHILSLDAKRSGRVTARAGTLRNRFWSVVHLGLRARDRHDAAITSDVGIQSGRHQR